jgi:hypothetical protein
MRILLPVVERLIPRGQSIALYVNVTALSCSSIMKGEDAIGGVGSGCASGGSVGFGSQTTPLKLLQPCSVHWPVAASSTW